VTVTRLALAMRAITRSPPHAAPWRTTPSSEPDTVPEEARRILASSTERFGPSVISLGGREEAPAREAAARSWPRGVVPWRRRGNNVEVLPLTPGRCRGSRRGRCRRAWTRRTTTGPISWRPRGPRRARPG